VQKNTKRCQNKGELNHNEGGKREILEGPALLVCKKQRRWVRHSGKLSNSNGLPFGNWKQKEHSEQQAKRKKRGGIIGKRMSVGSPGEGFPLGGKQLGITHRKLNN